MENNMISFVYFDIGGVIINDVTSSEKWLEMKRDMGIGPEKDEEFDKFYSQYEKEFCLGREVDTIMPLIREKFYVNFPANYSLFKDFVDRFKKNKYIQPVVDRIRQDCRVGLLTNMYPRMFSAVVKKRTIDPAIWDVIIDSSVEGCQKPDVNIFKLSQKKAGVEGKNILFIDNKVENTDAAKNFGWQVFLYNPANHKKSCSDLLDYYNQTK